LNSEEDNAPDPVAAPEANIRPQVFGSARLQKGLNDLLNEFSHIFAVDLPPEPAKLKPIRFKLDERGWKADRRSKQNVRPLSHEKEEALRVWIESALKNGIISRADTKPNWSQIHMVLKSNGVDYRFCVDYTVLNLFLESAGWPIPHIDGILRRIAAKKPRYFATMDSTQGFYQMEVELNSREFLCFTTFMGNFVWNRAPMGPKTVPAEFQRAMCMEVFPDLVHKIMEVYLDDFIVYASTEEELITNLKEVFIRLSDKNLKLNPKKCRFGMEEVEYCGHVINSTGITFSHDRISEVANFDIPKTRGELKSFLGMAGYMRTHVPHYVEKVSFFKT
jgi:hypothetical protein